MSEISFEGKVAVVTGAGRGLGRAYAHALASRGASVVVNDYNVAVDGAARADAANPADTVAAELRDAGYQAVANPDSVADSDGAARIIEQAIETFGRLDIVVNNAGVGMCDDVQDEPGPLFDINMNTALLGTILVTRAAWPHLVSSGGGRVLNVSSGTIFGSSWPTGGVIGAYTFAKAGVLAYTRQIARYGEEYGVKVNAVLPAGATRTNVTDGGALEGSEMGDFMLRAMPPEAVANGAIYLVSTDCPVTGQAFSITGGRVARVVYAEPRGFWSPQITPEQVRDNWDAVMGEVDSDHHMSGFQEIVNLEQEFGLLMDVGVGSTLGS